MKRRRFLRGISWVTSYFLLIAFLLSAPFSSNVLCIEADGSSSIETVHFSACQAAELSSVQGDIKSSRPTSHDHDHCMDCTDLSLSQQLSAKLQNQAETVMPYTLFMASVSFEGPVYTEPIASFLPPQNGLPSPLKRHLQTVIFLI